MSFLIDRARIVRENDAGRAQDASPGEKGDLITIARALRCPSGRTLAAAFGVSLVFAVGRLDAGTIVTWKQEGVRAGKPWSSTYVARSSDLGVRLDLVESTEPGGAPNVSFVWSRASRTLYVLERGRPEPAAIDRATVHRLEARLRASGRAPKPGRATISPLGTEHRHNGFGCVGFVVKRPGHTPLFLCLADPGDLGVDDVTMSNLRDVSAILVPFLNAVRRLEAGPKDEDADDGFDSYRLPAGFPVREIRSRKGVVLQDSRLVRVEKGDVPASLFDVAVRRPPAPLAPLQASGGPASAPASVPETLRGVRVAPDRSLAQASYVERGLPSPDLDWSGPDYARAARVLDGLARSDPSLLPRHDSPVSGVVFERLTADANLALLRPGRLAAAARLAIASSLAESVGRVAIVYAAAGNRGAVFDAEMVELMRYLLRIAREMLRLEEEVSAGFVPDEAERADRERIRKRVRDGAATTVEGCLEAVGDRRSYRPSETIRLVMTLEEVLPGVVGSLPETTRRELPARIHRLADEEPDTSIRIHLKRMAAFAEKAARGPA